MDHRPILNTDRSRRHVHPSVFVAETSTLVGDIVIGENSSVWFAVVIRADGNRATIGRGTNVQDGVIIHADTDNAVTIGDNVSLGHAAIVHGAVVEDNVVIGIGARVLSGARVGEYSLVAAGALVPEGVEIPPRSVVMGMPGRVVRQVSDKELDLIHRTATRYASAAAVFKSQA
ncbi:MAG: gamma carbonic anhydrase family protein [Chloroflexota bacterium]|nr:MAG: gamma carbonic anhydrase family protein [Chloroflexota bacterium]